MELMKTFGSLFSGFGGVDCAFSELGFKPAIAVEYDAKLAEVYRANHGNHVLVADVREVDYKRISGPDYLWMSPVCTNASVANANAGESEMDIQCAKACARAIDAWRPQCVFLENVWAYRDFEAFKIICRELEYLEYGLGYWHLNSADYGVAQTRKRLIMVARRDGRRPVRPEPTHARSPQPGLFGQLKRWVGWYEAIEDLIPTLPESKFAQWQLDRLEKMDLFQTGLVDLLDTARDATFRPQTEPSMTIRSNHGKRPSHMPLDVIVEGSAAGTDNAYSLPVREADEPVFTQRAGQNTPRALLVGDQQGQRVAEDTPAFTITAKANAFAPAPVRGRVQRR